MAKFVLVFLFALFALQGSIAASLEINQTDSVTDDFVQDFINEINKSISDAASRDARLTQILDNKFNEIVTAANFTGLLSELKRNITETLAEGGDAALPCEHDAWWGFEQLEDFTSKTTSCRLQIDQEALNVRQQVQNLLKQVQDLMMKISDDVAKCIRSSSGSHKDFVNCMKNQIGYNRNELNMYNEGINYNFKVLEGFIPMYNSKMTICVDDNKQEFIVKMKDHFDWVQSCSGVSSRTQT